MTYTIINQLIIINNEFIIIKNNENALQNALKQSEYNDVLKKRELELTSSEYQQPLPKKTRYIE